MEYIEDFQRYASHISHLSTVHSFAMRAKSFTMAIVDEVSTSSPSLTSLILLLLVLFLSLQVLGMLWRAIVFWVNLAIKAALFIGVAVIGVWVFSRGPDGFMDDVQDIVSYWLAEYKRYSGHADTLQQWGQSAQQYYARSQKPQKPRKRGW